MLELELNLILRLYLLVKFLILIFQQLVVVMTRGLPVCGCTIVARFQLPSASRVTHTADPTFLQPDWGFERAWIAACFADERHG